LAGFLLVSFVVIGVLFERKAKKVEKAQQLIILRIRKLPQALTCGSFLYSN
jgi:hypothetical protein